MNSTFNKSFTAIFALSLITISTFAEPMQATVVSAKGKSEVQRAGQWVAIAEVSKLNRGDVIQTGFKSELILKIKNSTVTVSPLSRVTIEQLAEKKDSDETKLFLDTGSLKSNVKKTEDRRVGFTVRSPVATASVRGTVMEVKNVYGGTEVIGYEGSTAAWKSTEEQTPDIEMYEEPSSQEIEGNGAEAVSSGQAEAGAVLVKKNQKSSYTQNSQTPPKENSARSAADIGGILGPDNMQNLPPRKDSNKASLTVNVTIKEE